MEYIVGLLFGLVGWLFFERSKRKSAEGLLENVEVKKEINKLQQESSKVDGMLEAEEAKRNEIKTNEEKKSLDDIAKFLNDRK